MLTAATTVKNKPTKPLRRVLIETTIVLVIVVRFWTFPLENERAFILSSITSLGNYLN
ncbi:hypothetical protein RIVM261_007480 [Rivularia sp. IAM M-261]|nr:hypothetical protein CAL7716_064300 [Calothrix sp. PCC 7716]GJD15792.1 hypothetical protein RIVM261_007480 [Rivularia sp. IAM M-261]